MAKQAQIDAVRPVLTAADNTLNKIEGALDVLDKVADKSTDVVESGLEKVADVVPDALDTAVHVSTQGGRSVVRFFRNPKHAAITVLILSTTAGAALGVAGYFAMKKKLELKLRKEYDLELESEIAAIRRQYALRNKDGDFSTPATAVEALMPEEAAKAMRTYRGQGGEPQNVILEGPATVHLGETLTEEDAADAMRSAGYTDEQIAEVQGAQKQVDVTALQEKMRSGAPVEIVETVSRNIFLDGTPIEEFDYQAELLKRNPDEPYVIHHDEFMENENGFEHNSLTYYNGDDILTDDQDIPIPDIEALVGSEALTRFGHGSLDKNVVYVRNEKNEAEYEITFSQGEFSKEVAGFQHSAPIRRMRKGDGYE